MSHPLVALIRENMRSLRCNALQPVPRTDVEAMGEQISPVGLVFRQCQALGDRAEKGAARARIVGLEERRNQSLKRDSLPRQRWGRPRSRAGREKGKARELGCEASRAWLTDKCARRMQTRHAKALKQRADFLVAGRFGKGLSAWG